MTDYINQIRHHTLLDAEEENTLLRQALDGCIKSRDELIRCNQRLVIKIARQCYSDNVDMDDLISEGNIGLMKAIEKFDPDAGTRFSTYAVWWIRQACQREVKNHGATVRVPIPMQEDCLQIGKAFHHFRRQGIENPSPRQVAEHLDWPMWKVESRMAIMYAGNDESEEYPAVDYLHARECVSASAEATESIEAVRTYLSQLTARQRAVTNLRYDHDLTMEQIGEIMGTTRQRVQQIHAQTLEQLRGMA